MFRPHYVRYCRVCGKDYERSPATLAMADVPRQRIEGQCGWCNARLEAEAKGELKRDRVRNKQKALRMARAQRAHHWQLAVAHLERASREIGFAMGSRVTRGQSLMQQKIATMVGQIRQRTDFKVEETL